MAVPSSPSSPLLSEAQRRELDERGFVFTRVLFSADEIEPVRRACAELYAGVAAKTAPSTQERLRPFMPSAHAQSEIVAEFARHPVFQQLARELIGPDVDQVWNQICLKLPDEGEKTVFPFHQDSKFADVDYGDGGMGCFLGLGPLSVENGTLHFAAGAHRRVLDHAWNGRANWWECSVEEFEVVPGVLEPGQMVLYHPMTPHGSPPNRTAAPREAMLLAYGPPGVHLVGSGEPFGDQRPILRGGRPVS